MMSALFSATVGGCSNTRNFGRKSGREMLVALAVLCCMSLRTSSARSGTSTLTSILTNFDRERDTSRCEVARIQCAHRQGCSLALQHYMVDCADLIAGKTDSCHLHCQRALIALVSSDEGQALMDCNCHGSTFCELR